MKTDFVSWRAKPYPISGFFFSLTRVVEIFTQFQTKKGSKPIDTLWSRLHPLNPPKKALPGSESSNHHVQVVAQFHNFISLHPHCPCLKRLAV